jgi:class 3 adenylate cyclase
MPPLSARKRASLQNSAFAYIDSRGRRRLPIHDEAHVRNALARFNQVAFESDAARERARKRLLIAARKHGIVPVGFITGELQRARTRAADAPPLPAGFVTFLMTDIEASTALVHRLGNRYAGVLRDVRGIVRAEVSRAGGREVDARADEYFAVFERAAYAVEAAVAIQRALGRRRRPDDLRVHVRIGVHAGRPGLFEGAYVGLPVHTTARICAAAHGGQIVLSGEARTAIGLGAPAGVHFRSLGRHRLAGLGPAQALYQVVADGLPVEFPRPRAAARKGSR